MANNVTTVVRGATVKWTCRFADEKGELVVPPMAKLYLSFKTKTGPGSETIDMTQQGELFIAEWNSTVALAGVIDWYVKTSGANSSIAEEGQFSLIANKANMPVT